MAYPENNLIKKKIGFKLNKIQNKIRKFIIKKTNLLILKQF
jgi:hypothetical protein